MFSSKLGGMLVAMSGGMFGGMVFAMLIPMQEQLKMFSAVECYLA